MSTALKLPDCMPESREAKVQISLITTELSPV